jgi:hypothetical protein
MPLEVLHFAFVLFGLIECSECAKVAALSGRRILFSRIQTVLPGFEFANHSQYPMLPRATLLPDSFRLWKLPPGIQATSDRLLKSLFVSCTIRAMTPDYLPI